MKIRVGGRKVDMKAVWWEGGRLMLIDQRLIPDRLEVVSASTVAQAVAAIKDMTVRGAPSIGAAAAYAMALPDARKIGIHAAARKLKAARPTAVDLANGVDYMLKMNIDGADPVLAAQKFADGIVRECRQIGGHGSRLIRKNGRVMTHCNAGALATVDFGTALAPMRVAQRQGKKPFVLVSETRPRFQGAKLTAWELLNEGIAHRVFVDGAAGHLLKSGAADLVITGADRITLNGDAANKIGTYEKAVLAKENGVPFYVAAPLSSFDRRMRSGTDIIIEERSEDEVLAPDGRMIAAKGVRALNPGFDVTPAKYITGIITQFGVIRPCDVKGLAKRQGV